MEDKKMLFDDVAAEASVEAEGEEKKEKAEGEEEVSEDETSAE